MSPLERAIRDPESYCLIWECVIEAAKVINQDPMALLAKDKSQEIARARQGAMWLARQKGLGPSQIAGVLGLDHSTVNYGIKKAQERFDTWGGILKAKETS